MKESFNTKLIQDLARSFSRLMGLGCTVHLMNDDTTEICRVGETCETCELCQSLGRDATSCAQIHRFGVEEAERFGGRYVYECGRGLTFFVSPVVGSIRSEARVTVGPFLMVDAEDFCACELEGREECLPLVTRIPYVQPERVTWMSTVLYMAVGYLNAVSAQEMLHQQDLSEIVDKQVSAYILEVKQGEATVAYPYQKEQQLLEALKNGKREETHRLLGEMLGQIHVCADAAPERTQTYVTMLLMMMFRSVQAEGADRTRLEKMLIRDDRLIREASRFPDLCRRMAQIADELMDSVFEYKNAEHASALAAAFAYIREHASGSVTLEDVAFAARLSPTYFSRIFHQETGQTVQQAIMTQRIRHATELLSHSELALTDIALLSGFQDAAYFSRVFRKEYGISPSTYRKNINKII